MGGRLLAQGYRRAPARGEAWVNPGCRNRMYRGGAWSSAPVQARSAWRVSGRRGYHQCTDRFSLGAATLKSGVGKSEADTATVTLAQEESGHESISKRAKYGATPRRRGYGCYCCLPVMQRGIGFPTAVLIP